MTQVVELQYPNRINSGSISHRTIYYDQGNVCKIYLFKKFNITHKYIFHQLATHTIKEMSFVSVGGVLISYWAKYYKVIAKLIAIIIEGFENGLASD